MVVRQALRRVGRRAEATAYFPGVWGTQSGELAWRGERSVRDPVLPAGNP